MWGEEVVDISHSTIAWLPKWQRGQRSQSDQLTDYTIDPSILTPGVYCIMENEHKNKQANKQKNGRKELKHVSAIHIERNMDWGVSKRELHLCWDIYAVDLVLPMESTVMSSLAQSTSNTDPYNPSGNEQDNWQHSNHKNVTPHYSHKTAWTHVSWTFYWKPPRAQWTLYIWNKRDV